MLQIDKRVPSDEPRAKAEAPSPAEVFATYADFVRRQIPLIVAVMLLAVALGVVYSLTTPPSYTANAKLSLDSRKVQVFQQPSIVGDPAFNTGMVDSQVETLKSENISLAVIKDLKLWEDAEFTGPTHGLVGRLFELAGTLFGTVDPKSEFELIRTAVGRFAERLTVKRVGLTYIIDIGFTSLNPDRAAQIANAVAEAYIVDQLEAKYQATRRASAWLQDRIRELREQATAAERAVVQFRSQHNIVATGTGGRLVNEQQLVELNTQILQSRTQTADAKARLDRVEEILRAGAPDATVNESLRSDVINQLRRQYLDLKAKEADWSNRFGADHLAAINLRNQMFEIRRAIFDELQRIAETYKSDYEIAKQREEVVQKALDDAITQSKTTSQAQIELRELESTAQTYRALHDNFLQRYMESLQQETFPITDARVVTAASRPMGKSHPNTLLVLAISLAGGLILGLGLAALRDMSDRVFRTTAQVEELLQSDCISVIPLVKGADVKPSRSSRSAIDPAALGPRTIVPTNKSVLRYVVELPLSRFTEAIRSIKVAVDINGAVKSNKTIGFTSAFPSEGKSTVACSFAQLIADTGSRVILVDCDLRNPSLTRALAPTGTAGLFDVIAGRTPLEDAIWTDPVTKLNFLPATLNSGLAHTSEVLRSSALKGLFEKLSEDYDYVVVDLSPLAPIVDTRSTAHFIDSYVLVVEWGRTQRDVVVHALNTAWLLRQNLLGVVLNKSDTKALSRYEHYYGKNKYARHYSRYGYTNA
jgi:polysaccharide biosynthesis transport protein